MAKTQVAVAAGSFGLVSAKALTATDTNLHAKFHPSQSAKETALVRNPNKADLFDPAYTVGFDQQLGVLGAEYTTDLTQAPPTLETLPVTGSATIPLDKSVSTGVRLLNLPS